MNLTHTFLPLKHLALKTTIYIFKYVANLKIRSLRWEHTQTQTDARTKYIRGATQMDARDHFWASEIRRPVGDALSLLSDLHYDMHSVRCIFISPYDMYQRFKACYVLRSHVLFCMHKRVTSCTMVCSDVSLCDDVHHCMIRYELVQKF
jgi:hypothetical protein